MVSARHSKQTVSQGIHSIVAFEYEDEAARLAATDFDPEDRYKVAIQLDNMTLWVLTETAVIEWAPIPVDGIATDLALSGQQQGDIVYFNGTNWVRLAPSSDGYVLTTHSTGQNPTWSEVSGNITGNESEQDDGNSGTSDNIDWSTNPFHKSTLTGNVTYTFTAPPPFIRFLQLKLVQDGVGNRTVNWPGSVTWVNGSEPAIDGTAGSTTFISFYYDGSVYWGQGQDTELSVVGQAQGDVLYFDGTNWVRLPASTDGYFLQTHSTSQNPSWAGELKTTLDAKSKDIIDAKTITFDGEFNNGTSGSAKTIDWNNAQKQLLTLSATTVLTFIAPRLGVGNLLLRIVQDSTPRTITWPGTVKWVGGAAPVISTGSGAIDIITFYWNGTNYYGVASLNFA